MVRTARDVMQKDVVSVRPDMPMSELESVLLRKRVHGAPVVENGRVVGIVSRSDVVRQLKLEEERLSSSASYLEPYDADLLSPEDRGRVVEAVAARLATLRVRDFMIPDVIHVAPDAPLQEVAQTLLERRIQRVLVMQDGELLGLISSVDLLRLIAEGKLGGS